MKVTLQHVIDAIPENGSSTSHQIAEKLGATQQITTSLLYHLTRTERLVKTGKIKNGNRWSYLYARSGATLQIVHTPDAIECITCKTIFIRNPGETDADFTTRKHCNAHKPKKNATDRSQDAKHYHANGSGFNTLLSQLFLTGRMDCQQRKTIREMAQRVRAGAPAAARQKTVTVKLREAE